jgi:hypothetical protein
LREQIAASGVMPVDFRVSVMRDGSVDLTVRIDAVKPTAPFLHARLSSVELSTNEGGGIKVEIVRFSDRAAKEANVRTGARLCERQNLTKIEVLHRKCENKPRA